MIQWYQVAREHGDKIKGGTRIMGILIAEKRRDMGMTQLELAERIGVRQETMSRIERGAQVPSYVVAKSIAEVLGESKLFEPSEGSHERFFRNANQSRAFRFFNIDAVKTFLSGSGVEIDTSNIFGGGDKR